MPPRHSCAPVLIDIVDVRGRRVSRLVDTDQPTDA